MVEYSPRLSGGISLLRLMRLRTPMESNNPNEGIDLNLVDNFISCIPGWTWSVVKEHLVTQIVDAMPSNILEQITGDPQGDERAIEILDDYYKTEDMNQQIIVDCFNILGTEQTAYALDSLQLDKIKSVDASTDEP